MDDNPEQLAQNEARFRALNQRIHAAASRFNEGDADTELFEMLCECASSNCREMVEVTITEYSDVRALNTRFLVRPGHANEDIEVVVRQTQRYWVVEKFGRPAEVVRNLTTDGEV